MKAVSLFSGVGGMDLGLERAGIETMLQAESDPYCLKVLEKHWPNVRRVDDVRKVGGWVRDELGDIDLVYGGPPCQPSSVAGRRQGPADERWLWGEAWRVVREVRPRLVLMENPPGVFQFWGDVLGEMAESGYDGEWDCIPAAAVGAPHIRDRVWLVAYPAGSRLEASGQSTQGDSIEQRSRARSKGDVANPIFARLEGDERGILAHTGDGRPDTDASRPGRWAPEPDVGRVANGIPHRVDRLRALGNAVVPQVAQWIGERLIALEPHSPEPSTPSTDRAEGSVRA